MKIKIKLPTWNLFTNIKKKIKKYRFPICCAIGILGVFLLGYITFLIITDYQKELNGVRKQATITSLNYIDDYYVGTITYLVEDIVYEKQINIKEKDITVNDKVEIKYDKNNPNILIENNHFLQILCLFLISIICLKIGLDALLKYYKINKKKKSLKEKGILIYADVDSVYINNRVKKKKGRLPYRIRLKYQNPIDHCLYTYESNDIYFNIKLIMEEKGVLRLPVYLNKENTSDYYIDLEFLLPKEGSK